MRMNLEFFRGKNDAIVARLESGKIVLLDRRAKFIPLESQIWLCEVMDSEKSRVAFATPISQVMTDWRILKIVKQVAHLWDSKNAMEGLLGGVSRPDDWGIKFRFFQTSEGCAASAFRYAKEGRLEMVLSESAIALTREKEEKNLINSLDEYFHEVKIQKKILEELIK